MADVPQERGSPILISFKELQSINDRLASLTAKLDVALSLPSMIQELEKQLELAKERISSLETERAVRDAKGGVYGKLGDLIWGLALVIIGTGVWWDKLH